MSHPDADTNIVVVVGTVAVPPAVQRHRSGAVRVDLTVVTRATGPPRRVDAIPIVWWDPPPGAADLVAGSRVSVVGTVRRRFWATGEGRQSRLEVHAGRVEVHPPV